MVLTSQENVRQQTRQTVEVDGNIYIMCVMDRSVLVPVRSSKFISIQQHANDNQLVQRMLPQIRGHNRHYLHCFPNDAKETDIHPTDGHDSDQVILHNRGGDFLQAGL